MTDKIKFKGTGRVTLTHDDGRVEVYEQHNMIVNSGFNIIISSLISSERPAQLSHVAIGTGTTATSETQTTLVAEKYRRLALGLGPLDLKNSRLKLIGIGVLS